MEFLIKSFGPFGVLLGGDHQRALRVAAFVVREAVLEVLADLVFALDVAQVVALVPQEAGVPEALPILGVPCLVEVVHVQLAHEAAEVVVLEVLGQHGRCEFICVFHDEAVALLVPKDSLIVGRVLQSKTESLHSQFQMLSTKMLESAKTPIPCALSFGTGGR